MMNTVFGGGVLILSHRNSSVNVDYFPNRTHESIDPSGTVERIWAFSVLKFHLRWRPGRRDWWCLRWQTDTLEVSVYRGGVGGSDQSMLVRWKGGGETSKKIGESSSGCETHPTKAEPGRSVASLAAFRVTGWLMRRRASVRAARMQPRNPLSSGCRGFHRT